jgi:hypothetical protein
VRGAAASKPKRVNVRLICDRKAIKAARSNPSLCALRVLRVHLAFGIFEKMPVKSIQLGQVWRNDKNGSNYLVTKVYSEVFTRYAILRQADANAATSDIIRVKVQNSGDGQSLPGYTYTQEAQDF